ncbi:MAG: UDP-N-acetylmuramoyl-L-alanyl-D-glutamate--2,6-diaminopimelate ligase [Firmicutes bacterium]|nr:UDP-N-acetylmuramoyl-L-alanyl-D-glutamate--2,6-diaminopimelate ligase [Bacillota bacterium]
MKLFEFAKHCTTIIGDDTIEIKTLASHTDNVQEGCLFFAIEGVQRDGTTYLEEAIHKGAIAVVVSKVVEGCQVPQLLVSDVRGSVAKMASVFYGNPSEHLKILGVTGTNGKTTTTYLLQSIFASCGLPVCIIGTNGVWMCGQHTASDLTTPDPIYLHSIFFECVQKGVKYVVMEVSAHAIHFDKIAGIQFEVVGFCNLSQDHFDFFGTMENYFATKAKLFSQKYAKRAVINTDDAYGRRLVQSIELPLLTFGVFEPSDVFAVSIETDIKGCNYVLNYLDDLHRVRCALPGKFNVYNSLCAISMAKSLGLDMQCILQGIKKMGRVEGRFNVVHAVQGGFDIVIDYAHTEDGLENILKSIKELAKARVITVFGCGGNRDKGKRPLMGRVAAKLSDCVLVTSDNPRNERPEEIVLQIVKGVEKEHGGKVQSIVDRKQAIQKALELAQKNDIVLLAGKGAEKHQEIDGQKIPYQDEQYVRELLDTMQL